MKERIIRQRWSRNFQAGKEKYKKKKREEIREAQEEVLCNYRDRVGKAA